MIGSDGYFSKDRIYCTDPKDNVVIRNDKSRSLRKYSMNISNN